MLVDKGKDRFLLLPLSSLHARPELSQSPSGSLPSYPRERSELFRVISFIGKKGKRKGERDKKKKLGTHSRQAEGQLF